MDTITILVNIDVAANVGNGGGIAIASSDVGYC